MIMKHFNKYILIGLLSFTAIGCVNEKFVPEIEEAEVPMTFIATIEKGEQTKTMLGDSDDNGHRKLLWNPGDSIGIVSGWYSSINKFVNTNKETSEKGVFEGSTNDSDTYYAMYPYSSENDPMMNKAWYYSSNTFYFSLPSVQKYAEGTFASDVNFMVAKAEKGEDLQFKNLCGILVIKITGEETIKSISISAKDETGNQAKLSGPHSVTMDYVEAPVLTAQANASSMITLDCGEGVAINSAEPTPFYAVLPPGSYSDLMVTIGTADGKVMLKEGKNLLNINRAEYITAGTLAFEAEIAIDLSSKGTANCYIVTEPGLYTFDASTIGNGEFGLTNALNNSAYHTTDATINPESVELLWSDGRGSVGGISYDKNSHRVNFVATGTAGNSVIAAKDADGKIVWSWHIWASDEIPADHHYVNTNGSFTVLDRNIGALRANGGSSDAENRESIGTVYQWGRKDPFFASQPENGDWKRFYNTKNTRFTTVESIQMPNHVATGSDDWNRDGLTNLWSTSSKTIYDPCPVGYRVAVKEVFSGFTTTGNNVDRLSQINYSGTFDKGFELKYDGNNTAWYPATYNLSYWGELNYSNNSLHTWTANPNMSFWYEYQDDMVCNMGPGNQHNGYVNAFTVRCMKDDATSSLIVKINDMTEVGSTTASASAKVSTYGDLEVIQAGFVVGSHDGVTVSNGTVFESNTKTGQIIAQITGLEPLTRYYIKAFATTSEGTTYSEAKSFFTPNNEGVVDLSLDGTANSYIVQPAYSTYSFKTVKGNSNESVGAVASVEILWETYNTSDAVTQNSVIASVELDGDKVKFTMPEEAVPGNAVIAVTNADGTILWSWHIWVVDFDPEVTKQTYKSGAVMMDRNLGALHIADYDPRTHGLYYQWGRKDPFVNPVSSYDFAQTHPAYEASYAEKITDYSYSIKNPTVSLVGTQWNSDNSLWGVSKTIYDPCPPGWQVPPGGSNNGAWSGFDYWYYGSWGSWGALSRVDEPYSVPDAYYSSGGYIDEYNNIQEYESSSYCYSSTRNGEYAYSMHISDWFEDDQSTHIHHKFPVRCMKQTKMEGGSNEGYGESDDYEW